MPLNALKGTRFQSLDRGGLVDVHDREFIPIRETRDRSRDRSLERGLYLEDELYGRSARQSPNPMSMPSGDRGYLGELHHQNSDLQRELGQLKRELELTNQKLGSSMHSIKTFWSPELKKERALRKEESHKYGLINEQLKILNSENQVSDFCDNLKFFFFIEMVKCRNFFLHCYLSGSLIYTKILFRK